MQKLHRILTIFAIVPSLCFSATEISILSGKKKVAPGYQPEKYCAECAFAQKQTQVECTSVVDRLVDKTMKTSLYSLYVGQKTLEACSPTTKISASALDYNLSNRLKHDFNVSQHSLEACFEKNEINFGRSKINSESAKKTLTAYLHTVNRNILDLQNENLKEIGAIDQLLGKKPLENFECGQSLERACNQIRSCANSGSMDDVVKFSMKGLSEMSALELQKGELRSMLMQGKITYTQQKEGMKDIEEKIAYLKSLMPWLQGDILKKSTSSIIEKLKSKNVDSAQSEFKTKFTKQISEAKEGLKKQFYETAAAQNCLKNNTGCTSKILTNINSFAKKNYYSREEPDYSKYNSRDEKSRNAFIEAQDTNYYLALGKCVSDLTEGQRDFDESIMLIGSTGAGLLVGGLGGVLKLGQVALKFYQAGSRAKAIGSAALLSAEGKSMVDSFSSVANECQKAVNNLEKAQAKGETGCSASGASNYKLTNLNSCIVNISMTTLPFLMSVRGLKGKSIAKVENGTTAIVDQKADILSKITNPFISVKDKDDLAAAIAKLELTGEESAEVIKKLNNAVKSEKDKNRLRDYMRFVLSLKKEEQKLAIDQLHDAILISGDFNPGGYAQKFYLKENKFYLYEKAKTAAAKKKLMMQGKSEAAAEKEAVMIARKSRDSIQRKYYSCQSKSATPELKLAAKRYTGLSVALGVGGTTYGYVSNNKDKYESNKSEFFGKLGYDVAMAYFLSKLSAGIMKSPEGNVLSRYTAANTGSAQIGAIDAAVYSRLYGVSEDEARKKVEEITHSKEAMQELKVLDQYINKNNLLDSFKDKIVDTYKNVLSSPDKEELLGKPPYDLEVEKFSTLSKEDLEKPEIKEKLVKAVLTQMNSGSMAAIFSSGDKGADRWVNDRAWNAAIGIPKGMAVGVGIFQTLCIGADKPVLSLGLASGIQFANQFLSGDGYYKFRKEFIGQ